MPAAVNPKGPMEMNLMRQSVAANSSQRGGKEPYHTRPLHVSRQLLSHEAVYKSSRDHKGNQAARALCRRRAECNGCLVCEERVARDVGSIDEISSKRRRYQQRISRENPRGSHHVDWKDASRLVSCREMQSFGCKLRTESTREPSTSRHWPRNLRQCRSKTRFPWSAEARCRSLGLRIRKY